MRPSFWPSTSARLPRVGSEPARILPNRTDALSGRRGQLEPICSRRIAATDQDPVPPGSGRTLDRPPRPRPRPDHARPPPGAHRRAFFHSDPTPQSPDLNVCRPQDLLSQVTAIRDAATESEAVVREITRDIQSLDLAKRNLVASMNALKRFQMLGACQRSEGRFEGKAGRVLTILGSTPQSTLSTSSRSSRGVASTARRRLPSGSSPSCRPSSKHTRTSNGSRPSVAESGRCRTSCASRSCASSKRRESLRSLILVLHEGTS